MSSLSSKIQHRKQIIRRVLEETGFAYTLNCEYMHSNADFAEFASSQALDSFKNAMSDPNLSYEQLCGILRKATRKEARKSCRTPWSVFMANYLDKHANLNDTITVN